jgi:hypothetical protein
MHALRRRTALGLALGLWARAEDQAHQHGAGAQETGPYRFGFLRGEEVSVIQRFAEILIPATERSGGAKAARVEEYIDHVLRSAAPSLQRAWRRGLSAWAKEKNAKSALDRVVAQEFAPKSAEDRFFVLLKNAVTTAFYTSEEGIQKELGYQGLAFLREYPGWNGEQFSKPVNYRPLLRARG